MKANAVAIIKTLRKAGFQAFIVGGAVRDLVMGKRPKDYDIATSAKPDEVRRLFPRTVPVGAAFGVVLVGVTRRGAGQGGERFCQVASFRRDLGVDDGRHPQKVVYTDDPELDVLRRDFTINGLLLDPVSGEILDFVEGRRDIGRRLVRTIGDPDERFAEDRLRMLRAVRFAATLDFELDPLTAEAVRQHSTSVDCLSQERIAEELRLVLVHPNRGRAVRMMHALGLLESILPEVAACDGVPQDEVHHPEGDVLEHTFRVLESLRRPDFTLALAALLHDVAKPMTRVNADRIRFHGHDKLGAEMAEAVCRRLKLSRRERDRVKELVGRHMLFINIKNMRESRLRRFVESEGAADHIELHRADCLASHGKLDNLRYVSAMKGKWARRPAPPDPLLRGRDLLDMGFAQGPRLGRILREVENLRLEGKITSVEEARDYVAANHEPESTPGAEPPPPAKRGKS